MAIVTALKPGRAGVAAGETARLAPKGTFVAREARKAPFSSRRPVTAQKPDPMPGLRT